MIHKADTKIADLDRIVANIAFFNAVTLVDFLTKIGASVCFAFVHFHEITIQRAEAGNSDFCVVRNFNKRLAKLVKPSYTKFPRGAVLPAVVSATRNDGEAEFSGASGVKNVFALQLPARFQADVSTPRTKRLFLRPP